MRDALKSYRHSRFVFVHDADDQPADGTFIVADRFARRRAIAGNHHALVHSRAMGIDGNLRHAFRVACAVGWLANDEPPTMQAWMLSGGNHVAFDAG
jgi:hypothetical protein